MDLSGPITGILFLAMWTYNVFYIVHLEIFVKFIKFAKIWKMYKLFIWFTDPLRIRLKCLCFQCSNNIMVLEPVYTYRYRHCVRQIYTEWMVMDHLMERLGSVPNLPIKRSASIGTMLNFDGEGHGHGNGDSTCKHPFSNTNYKFDNYKGFLTQLTHVC